MIQSSDENAKKKVVVISAVVAAVHGGQIGRLDYSRVTTNGSVVDRTDVPLDYPRVIWLFWLKPVRLMVNSVAKTLRKIRPLNRLPAGQERYKKSTD